MAEEDRREDNEHVGVTSPFTPHRFHLSFKVMWGVRGKPARCTGPSHPGLFTTSYLPRGYVPT